MGNILFGLVAGSGLTWALMGLSRYGCWRKFGARRRRSNPPLPGRKPAALAWPPAPPPDVAAVINRRLDRDIAIARRKRGLVLLKPSPAAPGMRREWLWSPSQMAKCGGPCWEAQDPRHCDCGALWRDVPTTPKPNPSPRAGKERQS